MLDAVVDYLPSPVEVPDIKGVKYNKEDEAITRKSSDEESFSALAFKIMNDPFVGSLTFMRVYSGKIEAGSSVLNSVKNKEKDLEECYKCTPTLEKISKLLMQVTLSPLQV